MRERKGFTLVELAIVLVIIGLLLGMVLKGEELIKNAKVKKALNQVKEVEAAVYTYYDKYGFLPGDDPRATSKFRGTRNGNGNGYIDGGYCNDPNEESCLVWQHLRKAGILSGDANHRGAEYLPRSPFGGPIDIFSYSLNGRRGLWVTFRNVPGEFALQIDQKLDDGNPQTGSVIAYNTNDRSYDSSKNYDIWISF